MPVLLDGPLNYHNTITYTNIVFRFLEWDYGSDLGYVKGQQTQVEAAQALSTLEKLAIGNYTEYLKESDEIGERIAIQLWQAPENPQHFSRRLQEVYERLMESIWNDWLRQLAIPDKGEEEIN